MQQISHTKLPQMVDRDRRNIPKTQNYRYGSRNLVNLLHKVIEVCKGTSLIKICISRRKEDIDAKQQYPIKSYRKWYIGTIGVSQKLSK